MQIRHMAWASLNRRRGRFAFLLIAVSLGIGTVVSLISLSAAMRTAVSDELDRFGANIIVTPKTRSLELTYAGIAVGNLTTDTREFRMDDVARIRTIPNSRNIAAVAPKVVGSAVIEGKTVLVTGANFEQERRIKSWWTFRGRFAANPDEVMLGTDAAQILRKDVGDMVAVGDRQRQVSGVIGPTGSIDDQALFADLATVQGELHRPNAVSYIEVSAICRGCPIEDIVEQIGHVIPHARVAPIRQAVAAREQAVRQFTRFAYGVAAVVLLVGGLVVTTTMMASVVERTQELGILRAVGFRRTQVAQLILLEALGVNLAGGATGWLVGTLVARGLGSRLTDLASPVPIDPSLAILAIGLAVGLGALGGTYPAVRAARMDPSQALRHI